MSPLGRIVAVSTSPFPYGDNITDGPGYRAWNLFEELSRKHEITILSLYESFHEKLTKEYEVEEGSLIIKCLSCNPRRVANQIREEAPDILYLPWSSLPFISGVRERIPTIIDYVGSGLLENYMALGHIPSHLLNLKINSFWQGDFLMTTGNREKYYLIGLLVSSRKLCFENKRSPESFIHVVPMTAPTQPPTFTKKVIQKNNGEFIILVAGAFLPWYDYTTLFRALKYLLKGGEKSFKVIFMGSNPKYSKVETTVKLLANKEFREKIVFTGRVPFKERANYYLSADVGLNLGLPSLENELATRTRIIDYLWGRLPLITSGGDEYSDTVVKSGAGFSYMPQHPMDLAYLLKRLIENPLVLRETRQMIEILLNKEFNVKNAISPLLGFVEEPYIDSLRTSPKRFYPKLLLQIRDLLKAFHYRT